MQYLTLDEVVAEALSVVKDKSQHEVFAPQWAWTALMQTGSCDEDFEVAAIKVKNYIAKKPVNCKKLDDIALYDSAGNQINYIFRTGKKRIFPDSNIIARSTNDDGEEEVVYGAVDVSEDRYNIHIGTNGSNVDTVCIRYYSLPLDAQGQPLIREDEKLSVLNYIWYMIARREDDNQSKVEANRQNWMHESDRARAAKKSSGMNSAKHKDISREWLRLIPNFNFSKF
jgi:hypothetical protein